MRVMRDSRKFSGHPYIGRIARSSLWLLSFLVVISTVLLVAFPAAVRAVNLHYSGTSATIRPTILHTIYIS